MNPVVLDASAVMAYFDDRPGAAQVGELFDQAIDGKRSLLMSVVNWGEVFYTVWRDRGRAPAENVAAEIARLPIEIVDADVFLTRIAAEFRAEYKLPYADCFAASLAREKNADLATADKDFVKIEKQLKILWTTGG